MASTFINPVSSSQTFQQDIFGASYDSTIEIYSTLTNFASAGEGAEDSKIVLPSGLEIDVNTLTGMTTYTTYLQFLQAHKEVIDNIFVFVKNLESKLDNLLSS